MARLSKLGNDFRGSSRDSSSSIVGDNPGDEGDESVVSDRKPIPGVSGVFVIGVCDERGSERRHDRARTPARRMIVPRAIYRIVSRFIKVIRVKRDLRVVLRSRKVSKFGGNRLGRLKWQ